MGNHTHQCDVSELKEVNATEITEPGDDADFIEEANFDETEDIAANRNDSMILEQTMRMFRFLVGLQGDSKFIHGEKGIICKYIKPRCMSVPY